MRYLILIPLVFSTHLVSGQCDIYRSTLNVTPRERMPGRQAIPYTHLREADVMWSKSIWRSIDLREKMNHPLYYPLEEIKDRQSLFQVIKCGIQEGTITAYGNAAFDDEFKTPLTVSQAMAALNDTLLILREEDDGTLLADKAVVEVTSADIRYYWIKEVWFFDKERSVMDVRIIGLAPVREKLDDDGITVRGIMPLFWIYFPEARHVLANYEVFNRFNDGERMSFDDLFWKRMFTSFITKESNVYDRNIYDYKNGIDALLEGERIRYSVLEFEHDLWEY